ncbi:MAG: recombinase family protein [Phycisphaerae bacterium]
MTNAPTTAIGYVRRSTNRQEESLEQQREKLAAFAASKGWTLCRIYEDDAISGSNMQRPGLESLLAHAEPDPAVGVVLAWERNRLARPKDPVDGLLLERRLIKAGKRVCYVATGQEADRSFTSGLVGFVEHYQNGDYLRKLSRDTMRGHVSRARDGLRSGGKVPFGYDRLCLGSDGSPKRIVRDLPDGTQVILNPETQTVVEHITDGHRYVKPPHEATTLIPSTHEKVKLVQELFEGYASGVPLRILRKNLNDSGWRTPINGIFTIGTLHWMLRNPAYKGVSIFNRCTQSKWHRYVSGNSVERQNEGREKRSKEDWIVIENAWPALVDAETFEKVQQRLNERGERHKKVTGRRVNANYFLSGTLTCGHCGGILVGHASNWKRGGEMIHLRNYVCSTHHKGDNDKCPYRCAVAADVAERNVLQLIREDLEHLKGDKELQKYIQEEMEKRCGHQIQSKRGLQARLVEVDGQISKLTTHLSVLDVQTATTLGLYAKAKALSEERQKVQAELDSMNTEIPELPSAGDITRAAEELLARMETLFETGTVEEKQEFVRKYVIEAKMDPKAKHLDVVYKPSFFNTVGPVDRT